MTEPNDAFPTEDNLDDKLAKLHAMIEAVNEKATVLSQQEANIKHAIEEEREAYEKRVASLKGDLMAISETRFDIQRELRKVKQEAESIERQKEQMERVKIQQQHFDSLTQKWDRMVMGAPWREWAKDHQIEGARRLSYRGRMILADTMGLGKTLTSIIALDMIRAMTSDADEQHPVVIETN